MHFRLMECCINRETCMSLFLYKKRLVQIGKYHCLILRAHVPSTINWSVKFWFPPLTHPQKLIHKMFFKRKFSQPLKFYISSKIHVCGSYTQQSSYNDAYYKTEVPSGASNHIPVNLYLISIQGIPLKCYTFKCYTSIPEVAGSYHLYYCKIMYDNDCCISNYT